jgi:uncharacterized protein (TIGR02594 family)
MIPQRYSWLQGIYLPLLVDHGFQLWGTTEIPGPKSNPEILAWAEELRLQKVYTNDDTAWCGLFMAYVVKQSGRTPIPNPLWARNWAKWGAKVDLLKDKASLGDVLVFERGSGGHVGIYIAEDATTYYVLGGNQSNTVNVARYQKSRLLAVRRPIYNVKPWTAKPYWLDARGQLIKTT